MRLSDFTRFLFGGGIFIKQEAQGNRLADIKVDYELSRSLYTTVPREGHEDETYQLGNFCTTAYIDTFGWYIGLPVLKAENVQFSDAYMNWQRRNRSTLDQFIKQTLIDARAYAWFRNEKSGDSVRQVLRLIPRECVDREQTTKNAEGQFEKFVFVITERGANGNEIKTTWTLEKGKESFKVDGEVPAGIETSGEYKTRLDFIPVFEQFNKKQSYMSDGIPEIAAAVPFIRRYDATMRKLGKHVDDGLVPRMLFKIKEMREFLKMSFGATDQMIDSGGVRFSAEQLQNVFLSDPNDRAEYLQKEDRSQSAQKLLETLFYIICEVTMPEYLYGSAMSSTNASVSEQSPVWAKKVTGKQGEFDTFFYWIADTYSRLVNAASGRLTLGEPGVLEIVWPEITSKDDVALMNALSSLVGALDVLLKDGVIGVKTAFEAVKEYISVSGDFESEQDAVKAYQRFKLELENIKERHAQGDVDTGEAINKLLGKGNA